MSCTKNIFQKNCQLAPNEKFPEGLYIFHIYGNFNFPNKNFFGKLNFPSLKIYNTIF